MDAAVIANCYDIIIVCVNTCTNLFFAAGIEEVEIFPLVLFYIGYRIFFFVYVISAQYHLKRKRDVAYLET